jgi:hypothetical protein
MSMRFVVKLIYNSVQLKFEICSDDTIYQVKQKIEALGDIESIKPEKQELRLGGEVLEDGRRVSDYNIHPGDKVRLLRKVAGVIQVFIRSTVTVEGRTLQSLGILIDPNSTVLELKEEYHKRTSYPVEHQRLLWGRYQLQDERSLNSYGIPHGTTINLVARLRGGH